MGERRRLEDIWLKFPNTFRMDAGSCWPYEKKKQFKAKKDGVFPVKKGDIIVKNPSGPIPYGISGAGDRLGWSEVEVTPEMVGKKLAVFTSIEDKSETDCIGVNQIIFLINVLKAGGIAKVFREGTELNLEEILDLPRRKASEKENFVLDGLIKGLEGRQWG
jgi:hypothetical protein